MELIKDDISVWKSSGLSHTNTWCQTPINKSLAPTSQGQSGHTMTGQASCHRWSSSPLCTCGDKLILGHWSSPSPYSQEDKQIKRQLFKAESNCWDFTALAEFCRRFPGKCVSAEGYPNPQFNRSAGALNGTLGRLLEILLRGKTWDLITQQNASNKKKFL